ncbi:MAG: M56 family peptidase [Acidobacteriales bacterium]|nr:MAG: M56 family peptidase [Terriglobales bacterium]
MSAALLWNNLLAYSAQVLVLVAAGGLLPFLLRVRHPRTQLVYFQALLVASLLLPMLQPWHRPLVVMTQPAATVAVPATPDSTPAPAGTRIPFEKAALGVLAAGAVARFLWLLVGFLRLRRYRVDAAPLQPLPEAVSDARVRTGADAEVRVSEAVGGPVTFGYRRPIILLPPAVLDQPAEAQFGIACHEFLHVRRRDWLFTVCEEFAGALLWFHPAVWWLLGQIRLAREQVVDRAVVSITEAREPYVQALLALGGGQPQLDLAPATLFLRKRHLANRIHSLLREVTVSKKRLVACYALSAGVLAVAAWLGVVSFPLEASPVVQIQQGAIPQDHVSVSVSGFPEPVLTRMRERMAEFQGRRYTMELRSEIARAAREIAPGARVPTMFQIETPEGSLVTTFSVTPPPPSGPVQIDVSRLAEPAQTAMRTQLASYEGRQYTSELLSEIMKTARTVDPSATGRPLPQKLQGEPVMVLIVSRAAPVAPPLANGLRIQVSGAVQQKKLTSQAKPTYPPLARQARIQGTVRFTAVIDKEGHVANLTLVSGHPLLAQAAQEAVEQWTYQPTLLNGEQVEVFTDIDVNFTLATMPVL